MSDYRKKSIKWFFVAWVLIVIGQMLTIILMTMVGVTNSTIIMLGSFVGGYVFYINWLKAVPPPTKEKPTQ